MATNDNIDVQFTARFVIKNAVDREALQTDYDGDLLGYIRELTKSEGLQGCTEDDYEIVEARELPKQGSILVGCDPERARQVHAVLAESSDAAMAELEADLANIDRLPEAPDDGMTGIERWLS